MFRFVLLILIFTLPSFAQSVALPYFDLGLRPAQSQQEVSAALQVLFLLSILTIAPSILIMMTAFVRVVIVLKFVQRALSLQQEPPNQVMMGLALFITFFIMSSTVKTVYENAYKPYSDGKMTTTQFFETAAKPFKDFMLKQTREHDIDLFLSLARKPRPSAPSDVDMFTLIPAFIVGELTRAFKIGVYIFIPFLVVDMIVSSVLMSMGMVMLPPVMISLPFKLILFVLVDGWHLVILQVVRGFQI